MPRAPLYTRPQPSHIAWRLGTEISVRRAIHGATTAGAIRLLLDGYARSHGARRGGKPRRWMTAEEYEAWRARDPGYRRDPAAHVRAAKKMSAAARKARAKAAARARHS